MAQVNKLAYVGTSFVDGSFLIERVYNQVAVISSQVMRCLLAEERDDGVSRSSGKSVEGSDRPGPNGD